MRTPLARAAAVGLVAAIALVAAWAVPPLAVAAVWPLLLFVPGWCVLAASPSRIDTAGRVGLAVLLSVAVSTHLVYWLSHLAGGYGRATVFAAAALLALAMPIAAWSGAQLHRPRWPTASLTALAIASAVALLVGAVLGVGLWRVTPSGVTSGGTNWSDLGVHLSIAETLNAGANFPPEVPYFAGAPLVYHWFGDFHAAILAEAAGLFSIPAMVVQSTVLAFALALVVYSLARLLVRGRGSRRIATIAALLAVFGGGLGYVRLIGDLASGAGGPLDLVAARGYDNQWLTDWPYFRIPSVMGTGLLAHRATAAGLPMLVGAILLLGAGLPSARSRSRGWRDRPGLIALSGLLGALLLPFHFFFFPVFPLLAAAWVIAGRRLTDAAAPRNALALLTPYLLAVPFALAPAIQAAGSGSLQLVAGWPSAPREDGIGAVLFFFLTNLGIPFVLAVAALFIRSLPRGGFLAAWVIGLFLVPNVVRLSVVDFDMNKYFQAMWIGVAILAAWAIHRWPLPAVIAVVALSAPSPLLVAAWTATSDLQVVTAHELAAARWVSQHTPPDAVFVTDGWVNSLTDAAGRRRLTTFAPYIANLGYRPDERIADVTAIYCGGESSVAGDLMRRYGATYIVDGARPQPCPAPVDFGESESFELVYGEGPLIWRLRAP